MNINKLVEIYYMIDGFLIKFMPLSRFGIH